MSSSIEKENIFRFYLSAPLKYSDQIGQSNEKRNNLQTTVGPPVLGAIEMGTLYPFTSLRL